MLEGGRGVRQAHRQYGPLEVAVTRAERGFGAILLGERDLVESGAQVDLAEIARSLQSIEQILHVRQRVAVAHGEVVEAAVVHAEAKRAILLLRKDDVGAP